MCIVAQRRGFGKREATKKPPAGEEYRPVSKPKSPQREFGGEMPTRQQTKKPPAGVGGRKAD